MPTVDTAWKLPGEVTLTAAAGDHLVGWKHINTTAHGFVDGDILRESADETYAKATGDTVANIGVGLSICKKIDADNFIAIHWKVRATLTITGHGLGSSFGDAIWLSDSTAGAMTATEPEPSNIGAIRLGYRIDANTIEWEPGILGF